MMPYKNNFFPVLTNALLALLFALCLVTTATAQTTKANQEKPTNPIKTITAQLKHVEAALGRDSISDATLNTLRDELVDLQKIAQSENEALAPQLAEAKAQLETLKPQENKDGEEKESPTNPETETLVEQREKLQAKVAELDAQSKLFASALVRINQLNNRITLVRQDQFTQRLFDQSESLLNPALWGKALIGLGTTISAISTVFSDWFSFLTTKAAGKFWQISGMIIVAALLVVGPLRYVLFVGLSRLARLEEPTSLQRSLHATWAVVTYTLVPFASLAVIILILDNADLLPRSIQTLSTVLGVVVFTTALGYGLIRVLLAPRKPKYRLLNIATDDAIRLYGLSLSILTLYAIKIFYAQISEIFFTPLETTIFLSGIASVLTAILIWLGLRMLLAAKPELEGTTGDSDGTTKLSSFALPNFIKLFQPIIWLTCLAIFAATLLGFVSLGSFLSDQMGRIFIILALLGMITALIDNLLYEQLGNHQQRTQSISKAIGLQPKTINQFGVLLNGVVRIMLYVAAALLIFAPWGVQSSDFLSALQQAIFSIQIGDLTISPINVLGAIVVFIVTLILVKSVQRWMERHYLPATSLDPGLKNSIQTSIGYVGFILATMLAFSYMGLDLSNIALVAGALSVGIGFGLQSIVNNFVSGLILLVERPIKTGDWVVVGEDQGYVRKISVRATKIETFDRATVIVPNSDLIANRVMNWMHNGSMGRIIIPIGVSYDADPEQVKSILLDVAEKSGHVASYPGPSVYFMDFGASSLDFQLRCYVQDINSSLSAKSDLRFAIFKALKDASIEIPFPQQDIHVRSVAGPHDHDMEWEKEQPKQQPQQRTAEPANQTRHEEIELDSGMGDTGSTGNEDS